MGRPKRVFPNKLHEFNLLHTRPIKMMAGVSITAIHLMKETKEFFLSIDTWSSSCSPFRRKKKNLPKLNWDIPVATDDDVIKFLDKNAWHEWAKECLEGKHSKHKDSEMHEAIAMLDKIFPDHEKVYFYELKSLISAYNWGVFLEYDYKTGELVEPCETFIDRRKSFISKYKGLFSREELQFPDNIIKLRNEYFAMSKKNVKDEKKTEAFRAWKDAEENYLYEHHDMTDLFVRTCKNTIVLPMAFSSPTVEGSSYEHAGEIYMIVTPKKIYFEIERHY